MNQCPVLLPGPRLLLYNTEKMGQITTTTEDMSGKWYMHCCYSLVKTSTDYSLVVHSKTAMGWNGS